MLTFVNKFAGNIYSQNGEDLIVAECLRRMGITTGHAIEIGGNDGQWMSNTRLLIEQGWSGEFYEAEWSLNLKCEANWAHRKDVKCICSKVDGHNVNAFVKDDCDLLSMDTDGEDFEIFKGLQAKPKIVIVEIDSRLIDGFSAQGGAGFRPMAQLGISKGYLLLCHVGNLIFIDRQYQELFPEINVDPLEHPEAYFLDSILSGDRAYLSHEDRGGREK